MGGDPGTKSTRSGGLRESRQLLRISGPLSLAALANMAVSITDVVMMGWLGPLSLGAGAAISDIYSVVFYVAAGAAAAGVPMLSETVGAGNLARLKSGFWEVCAATLLLGILFAPLVWHSAHVLAWLGIDSRVLPPAHGYAAWMAATLMPMLVVRVCFAYFSALAQTRIVFTATLGAIPLNVLGNGAFMFGWFGFEAMGMPGAGASSFLVAVYLALVLLSAVRRDAAFRLGGAVRMTRRGVVECWVTGLPIGVSSLGELGVYLFSTVIMVKFGAAAVAAHAVALRLSGLLYALPLGLSQAVTARVAYFVGANQRDRARCSVRTGLALSGVVASAYLFGLHTFSERLAGLFLNPDRASEDVIALAASLIAVLAALEFFTAFATVAMGALRGVKDTRVPMLYSLVCLWGIGFLGGMGLAFESGRGAVAFWLGLLVGAAAIAVLSVVRVRRTFGWRRIRVGNELALQD